MAPRATSTKPAERDGQAHQTPLTSTTASIELPPPCELFPSQGGGAPQWVELLPAGRSGRNGKNEVEGRDGRRWRLDDPAAVAAASLDGSKELPIDWEHATEIKAPQGEPAPAAGWITRLEVRGSPSQGALWGRVEWTERGRAAVEAREYRYLSPVFLHSKDSPRRILQVLSAGLTNSPNLRMAALNREGAEEMDIKEILKALGLSEDATVEQAAAAINTLKQERDSAEEKARNSVQQPSLDKFVPRADYDQAVEFAKEKAKNAEAKLAEHEAQAREQEIEEEIAKALEAGKITPATADYHREQCRAAGAAISGLERFRKYVEAAPEVARNTNLGGTPAGKGAALTGDAAKIAAMFGHTAEDLKEYRSSYQFPVSSF